MFHHIEAILRCIDSVDIFRLIAITVVIAIHTQPFEEF